MIRKQIWAPCVALVVLCVSQPATAVDDDELRELRAQFTALSRRLDSLEESNRILREENARLQAAQRQSSEAIAALESDSGDTAHATAASWADRIKLKGDFRLRHEVIDAEGRDTRRRARVRARASIVAQVNEDMEVGLGLASGGDDPVSTNQTLGNGGSSKGLNLDQAYFRWTGMANTAIVGGKFKNFLHKAGGNGLLWDGDWTPEGIGLAWERDGLFVNALGTWLESDSRNETEFAYGLQGGFSRAVGQAKLTAGLAYYRMDTAGKGTFYGDPDDFFGNSYDAARNSYLYDYHELELFADLGFDLGGRPLSLFFDYVRNQDAPDNDTGFAAGFKYGSAKARGSWEFAYIYQDLEADAVFGLLTDSDFGGGGTDARGHVLKGGYAIADNLKASLTYFVNETGLSHGADRDYDRLQLDLGIKY